MSNIKDTLKNSGDSIAECATQAKDWVKEKTGRGGPEAASGADPGAIKPQMDVISSCGCKVGTVDRMEGGVLKLTRRDSPDGRHHFVPMSWIDHVDEHVHLNKDAGETRKALESDLGGAVPI